MEKSGVEETGLSRQENHERHWGWKFGEAKNPVGVYKGGRGGRMIKGEKMLCNFK